MRRILLLCSGWLLLCMWSPQARAATIDKVIAELNLQLPVLRQPEAQSPAQKVKRRLLEWQRWWRQGQYGLVKQGLKDLRELKKDLGIRNFVTLSLFLLQRGDLYKRKGRDKEARFYYQQAIDFSPDLSEPRFRLAWLHLREQPTDVKKLSKMFWGGILAASADFFGLAGKALHTAYVIALFFFFLFVLFLSCVLVRHLRSFLFDFKDLFPPGVSTFQVELLSIILLFIPPLMGGGLLETLLFWTLIAWFYLTRSERVLASLCLLMLSGSAFMLDYVERGASIADSPVRWLYLLNETDMRREAAQALEERLMKKRRSFDTLWSLGLYYKRTARLKKAREYFNRALKIRRASGLYVNLGNLNFIEQEGGAAYKMYQKAIKLNRYSAEAHYNLALLLKHSQSTNVVQQQVNALEAAQIMAPKKVNAFQKDNKKQSNRFLMDVSFPQERYWGFIQRLSGNGHFVAALWPRISHWIPSSLALWVGLIAFVLLWLLLPVGRMYFHAKPCTQCGDMISHRHVPDHEHEEWCVQCVHLFIKKEAEAARRRVEKEIAISRYQRGRFRFRALLSVLLMGSGQILIGRAIKGFFLLGFTALIVALWYAGSPMLPHPFQLSAFHVWPLIIGIGILFLLFYIQALREILAD